MHALMHALMLSQLPPLLPRPTSEPAHTLCCHTCSTPRHASPITITITPSLLSIALLLFLLLSFFLLLLFLLLHLGFSHQLGLGDVVTECVRDVGAAHVVRDVLRVTQYNNKTVGVQL